MDLIELTDEAVSRLEALRALLLIDPFFKINVEISGGDFYSECVADEKIPLSWTIRLNAAMHETTDDINYSILEGLLKILMTGLSGPEKDGIISRLATSYTNVLSDEGGDQCFDTAEISEE